MNRAFLYGDGFFESIRSAKGETPLLPFHLLRIKEAMDIYGFDLQEELSLEWLKGQLKLKPEQDQIHRISFYRDGQGKYFPMNNSFKTHLIEEPEQRSFFLPLDLDLPSELQKAAFEAVPIGSYIYPKPIHPVFTVKSLSSAYYVMAAKYMVEMQFKCLMLLNEQGEIIEEISSNILCLRGHEIVVPPLDSGMVIGACLRFILANYGFQCVFESIKLQELENFDAVFLCQGSTGVRRVM